MSAAHTLAQAGVSFKVLEARNYTGGRTHAVTFGDPAVGQHVFEEGSNWVSNVNASNPDQKGGPNDDHNPVDTLARSVGLQTRWDLGTDCGTGDYVSDWEKVYDPTGGDGDADCAIRKAGESALDCVAAAAGKGQKVTESVQQALQACGWHPQTPSERVVDWVMTSATILPADQQELMMEISPDCRNACAWWGDDDRFVIDQHPRGYARALDEMTKDTVPPGDERVLLNKVVSKIAYSADGVDVSTTDGTTYTASVVIATLPIGVMLRDHKALFDPALPSDLAGIFDAGKMASPSLDKVFIQFPEVFWDNSLHTFVWAPADGEAPGDLSKVRNLAHKDNVPGSNTLHIYIGEPVSSKYEAMDDAAVQKAVLAKLARIYPNATIPAPSAFRLSRWGQDPFARGSYSAFKPGFKDDDYETLTTPIGVGKGKHATPRVYLAGEAMCDDLSGFTHGARQSGLQTAESYLYATGRQKKKPKDICWW